MKLEINKCYNLLQKGGGTQLIFLLSVEYIRTIYGENRFILNYSEVYGICETSIDFEDIEHIYSVEINDAIKKRLVSKWGEKIARNRGVIV